MIQALSEIAAFRKAREERQSNARQQAALFLISGIDLPKALLTRGEERARIQRRLRRLVERERLKGSRGHWSYDLNRHIALSQALARLSPGSPGMSQPNTRTA